VRVWNRYFERIPDALVDVVVTEAGGSTPAEMQAARRGLPVPPELAAWAAARSHAATAERDSEEHDDIDSRKRTQWPRS
jgi:hypothetical protein